MAHERRLVALYRNLLAEEGGARWVVEPAEGYAAGEFAGWYPRGWPLKQCADLIVVGNAPLRRRARLLISALICYSTPTMGQILEQAIQLVEAERNEEPDHSSVKVFIRHQLETRRGVVCFSEQRDKPLMWGSMLRAVRAIA